MHGEFSVFVETPYFSLELLLSYWSCTPLTWSFKLLDA